MIWTRTDKIVKDEDFNNALEDLLNQNSELFYRNTANLTSYQLNFLRALIDGVDSEYTKADIINKYNLSSSSNVIRLIKSLEKKEIIDISNKKIYLLDPIFKIWLKKEFKI